MLLGASLGIAITPSYLPLAVGNRWELKSPAESAPMVFEVTGRSADAFLVRWDNPWVKNVVYGFRPGVNQVLLQSLDLGSGAKQLRDGVVYFDFDTAGPKKWTNLVGEFLVLERQLRVETPSGPYEHCIHVRYRSKEKAETDYFLAPGVGFVQVGTGPAAYKLAVFRKNQDKPIQHNPPTRQRQ
jgi:hypothetical protein